jgi:quercetin dioxygenase-like cupin family protein
VQHAPGAPLELNNNFDQRVAIHSASQAWLASPIPGVDRRMLDRLGEEVARATSIVRYAPQSQFSPHVHTGGEEFLVLEGVFQDEHGDFHAGSYIRNPPESSHTPGSEKGCVIFVKLWQFDLADRTEVRIDSAAMLYSPAVDRPGIGIKELFQDSRERVSLEHWDAKADISLNSPHGMEILVIDGTFSEGDEEFSTQSWLRLPQATQTKICVGKEGARVWVKEHLAAVVAKAPQS